MPELHMDANHPHPTLLEASADKEMWSALELPDIVIPPPLYNPLPLQCLAAEALPVELKEEINRITARYGAMDAEAADTRDSHEVESNYYALSYTSLQLY